MADDARISAMTAITWATINPAVDIIPAVDISEGATGNRKWVINEFFNGITSPIVIAQASGVDIVPTTDVDCDILTVGNTGAGKLTWDADLGQFIFTTGVRFDTAIGIGAATPTTSALIIAGARNLAAYYGINSGGSNIQGTSYGFYTNIASSGTAAVTAIIGVLAAPSHGSSNTLGSLRGLQSVVTTTGGTITNCYGLQISNPSGGGAITTNYAIRIEDQTAGGTNYGVYVVSPTASYFGGLITAGGGFDIIDAKDIKLATTTGTKLGTATGQKLGFWNATPAVQQTVAADATVATLIAALTTVGLIKNA